MTETMAQTAGRGGPVADPDRLTDRGSTADQDRAVDQDPVAGQDVVADRRAVFDQDPVAELDLVLAGRTAAFALLHRPEATGGDRVEILTGDLLTADRLADLPLPPTMTGGTRHDLLALVPYRQIVERGFACHDDHTPLQAIAIRAQGTIDLAELMRRVPQVPIEPHGGAFEPDDESYAALVRRVLAEEIGRGEGSNFVLRRSFFATIENYSPGCALSIFRQLLARELGAYWTFLVHTGERTLIGATPERHVSLAGGTVVMNPISGTYRYPPTGPTVPGALRFLADAKEADELYMVVDEELKMMGRVCDVGARVVGPYLKEMGRLAHTEYLLEGHSSLDVREILRQTLLAPTVTGSPLESACRVISRYEQRGRGYYGGVLALIGQDRGRRSLDASILIRTAEIDEGGRVEIGLGATLVRHSDPDSEVAETRAKAAGLLAALGAHGSHGSQGAQGAQDEPADPRNRADLREPGLPDAAGEPGRHDAAGEPGRHDGVRGPGRRDSVQGPGRRDGVREPGRRDSVREPGRRDSVREPDHAGRLGDHPEVRRALAARNTRISRFWLSPEAARHAPVPDLVDRRILIVDAEDTFTAMLGHQVRSLGPAVTIRRFDTDHDPYGYDLVIVGPGPGDPRDAADPKIATLTRGTRHLIDEGIPFLSVCLGHQILAGLLGFDLVRRGVPNQGVQREIDFFGTVTRVGFYNTFTARCDTGTLHCAALPGPVEVSRDAATGEVHGLRGANFRSVQFHPESVLTEHGPDLLAGLLTSLLPVTTVAPLGVTA